jgi:ATP-dependent DNA ligase
MKCFTRDSNDYTLLYEPVLNKIKPLIRANKCILDGEILG